MKNDPRFPCRRRLRACLAATIVSMAPVAGLADQPGRPVRLPPVIKAPLAQDAPATNEALVTDEAVAENSHVHPNRVETTTDPGPTAQRNTTRRNTTRRNTTRRNTTRRNTAPPAPPASAAEVKARLAALKTTPAAKPNPPQPTPAKWLRSTTAMARAEAARRHLAAASHAYDVGAWLSAEASAWESLRWSAEAIDLSRRESGATPSASETATAKLRFARQAIFEARDFTRWTTPSDSDAIARTARSHVTPVLHDVSIVRMTATDAADRYLDSARVALSTLASESIEAAQALDLLAATYLTRGESRMLPGPTALCLRRAALQGQPQNADLAFRLGQQLSELGLWSEAQWAMEHSLSIEPNPRTASALASVLRRSGQGEAAQQVLLAYRFPATEASVTSRPKIPQITHLTPEQFAAVSPPPTTETRSDSGLELQPASARTNRALPKSDATSTSDVEDEKSKDEPGMIRSFFGSLRRVW